MLFVAIAFEGFENDLESEILRHNLIIKKHIERLFIIEGPCVSLVWAQSVWNNPIEIEITSINDATKKLNQLGKLWSLFSVSNHRRANLIQEKLYPIKSKPIQFLQEINFPNLGAWSLIAENKIIASTETNSPFPNGQIQFQESKLPPSRAYLKLWELFTCHNIQIPIAKSKVMDFGSAPGGWTWVLNELGCEILSFDRSELRDDLKKNKNIQHKKIDAFGVMPDNVENQDWFFSDLICYPPKLFEFIQIWIASQKVKNFVCTIKFQGTTDFETMDMFSQIPNSKIIHLYHNKHEVTWVHGECLKTIPSLKKS